MNNLIKSLTGLVDPYLIFDPKFKGREIEYLQDSQLVHLVQADVPSPKCSNCKVMMVKNGTFRPVFIHCLEAGGKDLIAIVRKQKFRCQHCGTTALSKIKGVKARCQIANGIKLKALMSLADNISVKDIAKLNHVSASTVQRVLEDSKDLVELNYDWLPLALSFDDFSSKNGSNMSILMINAANHRTIDVIESRQGKALLKAFYKYSRQARCQVRYVIVDLYPPYRKLIKEAFPGPLSIK